MLLAAMFGVHMLIQLLLLVVVGQSRRSSLCLVSEQFNQTPALHKGTNHSGECTRCPAVPIVSCCATTRPPLNT